MVKEIFSDRLRSVRAQRRMNIADLANRTGVSERTLRRYESGKSLPRADTVFRLAQALDTDVANLLDMRRIFARLREETDRCCKHL